MFEENKDIKTTKAEAAVLGTILNNNQTFHTFTRHLTPEMFTEPEYRATAEIVWEKMQGPGAVGITEVAMDERAALSEDALMSLSFRALKPHSCATVAEQLLEGHKARELSKALLEANSRISEGFSNAVSWLNDEKLRLISLGQKTEGRADQLRKTLKHFERALKSEDGIVGIPTGWAGMDEVTGGWLGTHQHVWAGRPGMGKTTAAIQACCNIAESGEPAAFMSLEMPYTQLWMKAACLKAGVPYKNASRGLVNDSEQQKIYSAIEYLSELPIYIFDQCYTVEEILGEAQRLIHTDGLSALFIDYLQLVENHFRADDRVGKVGYTSRQTKLFAKREEIPVILLSQLNRSVERRGGSKRPQLSDLRETGDIEQDADVVSFFYRPEYYSIYEDEDGNDLRGIVEFITAKNRHGDTETIRFKTRDDLTGFDDLPEGYFLQETKSFEDKVKDGVESGRISKVGREDQVPF